ncbi:hypothetical protein ABZ891_26520 [Streptomyces sp. NPDC047023]|uniref:hypothetical protein n=1 Tax=Streptomyces sp. NPDC047023 TaxID=3155139 RepID=UPI0033CB1027
MPSGLVRDAVLSSPAWPDIAAAMGRLDAARIDVARILTDAHQAGADVDQAIAAAAANTPGSHHGFGRSYCGLGGRSTNWSRRSPAASPTNQAQTPGTALEILVSKRHQIDLHASHVDGLARLLRDAVDHITRMAPPESTDRAATAMAPGGRIPCGE